MAPGRVFIAATSGGFMRSHVARIYANLCSDATPHYGVAQSYRRCSYSAREVSRWVSGDDEASVETTGFGSDAPDEESRRAG
jgi:hypothetical protein